MNAGIDIDALISDIVTEATTAALKEESELQCSVLRRCRQILERHPSLRNLLLETNPDAHNSDQVRDYWQDTRTEIAQLLWPALMRGDQPVFAALSLLTTSTAHTVLAPIPYLQMLKGHDGLRRSLWLNAPLSDPLEAAPELYEAAARTFSHALTNISYSVWIEDEPDTGWLALAHASDRPLYIPDVRALPKERDASAESVATAEEPYLGMASVLYIPLYQNEPTREKPAPAVLMLWSPVVDRWNQRFAGSNRMQPEVAAYHINDHVLGPAFLDELWNQFEWVELVAARDFSSQRRFDLQVINFVLALLRWRDGQNDIVRKAMSEFLHHTNDPIKALSRGDTDTVPVRTLVKDLVADPRGFVNRVLSGNLSLADTDVVIKRSRQRPIAFSVRELRDEPAKLDAYIPEDLAITLDRATAKQIVGSPAGNIVKYASALTAIRINISNRFATVKYQEAPNDKSREAFSHADGFKRYYAIRRGQAVTPILVESQHEASSGLGLWINRILESRTSAAARLYISPDWQDWSTSVVFKLAQPSPSKEPSS